MNNDEMSLRQRNTNGSESTGTRLTTPDKYRGHEVLHTRTASPTSYQRRLITKSFISVVAFTISVLGFGTMYSDLTSRDPCIVLREFTRDDAVKHLPRLFHFQSKTRDTTNETKTWLDVLEMSSEFEEYPNITKSSASMWTAVYWSDKSCKKLVEDHFPEFLRTFNSFTHNIQRVDSCRYLILSVYGGVYADTDISIHVSNANEFEHLIPLGVGLVESPYRYNEIWQNSLMTASSPAHSFWNITIEIMRERQGEGAVLSTTGPKMIGDAVKRFRQQYGLESKDEIQDVHTLPCELFQRLPLGEWDTTFLNIIGREVLARAYPMQGCGQYGDGRCEITRHTGKASWTIAAGIT
jgi:hypothetical protein